jgi:hypothetical protein
VLKTYNCRPANVAFGQKMTGWKKLFFVGLGFGTGIALVCASIVGGFVWYAFHTKPWNTSAVQAHFSTAIYNLDDKWNVKDIDLEYILYNSTSTDFTLSSDDSFLLIHKDALSPSYGGNYNYKLSDYTNGPK